MEDLRPLCYGVISALFAIAMITILMRIWVRGFTMRCFGWDDWAMASQLVRGNRQPRSPVFTPYWSRT